MSFYPSALVVSTLLAVCVGWHIGTVTTIAGARDGAAGFVDGKGAGARFSGPSGIACVADVVYVADTGNNAIRRISHDGRHGSY